MSSNGPRATSDGNRPENRRPERRPVRRHGVWREFISSTGKSYYFNIQTQENRWDKPDDWPVEPGENHRNFIMVVLVIFIEIEMVKNILE